MAAITVMAFFRASFLSGTPCLYFAAKRSSSSIFFCAFAALASLSSAYVSVSKKR